jgi:hypothetical protein
MVRFNGLSLMVTTSPGLTALSLEHVHRARNEPTTLRGRLQFGQGGDIANTLAAPRMSNFRTPSIQPLIGCRRCQGDALPISTMGRFVHGAAVITPAMGSLDFSDALRHYQEHPCQA